MLIMVGHFIRAAVCVGAAVFAYNRLQEGAEGFYLYAALVGGPVLALALVVTGIRAEDDDG
ncbi:hypothetical protein PS9374_04579 [Planomonospora sphaerica]|uniref:Uncharacterized protein n=1 Tax=Planomonospora sphaerica TaxID=161355 RepID=A0A161LJ66_9ACTN|nr:hypothetical protein PS9374_04579 [Planomonospora sphaerica]